MRTQEVIVSNPESKVIVGAVDVVKSVCVTVRGFVGAVSPFNHLFEWAVFRRNSIVVGKSDDLGDFESKVFAKLLYEFHCSERICTVTIGNELKVFRKLCESQECHTYGEDAGTNTPGIGYLIADDGACGRIHDEPDIGFDATDFNVGFVSGENLSFFVRVLVNKGFDTDSGGLAVVGYLLVGDADVV